MLIQPLTLVSLLAALLLFVPFAQAQSSTSAATDVRLNRGRFLVNGSDFTIKGIHYEPWRPGSGPNKGYPYPAISGVESDFKLIRAAHANTVLLVDAPGEVLDVAERTGLRVVYSFALPWWSVGTDRQAEVRATVVDRVKELKDKPALLAWMIGNELPSDVMRERGDDTMIAALRDLYTSAKTVDPAHPISYGSWPISKHLDLGFFDFMSFNLYPLWPPEVVAMGYGAYIERVLRPLAGDKPILISEFGVNTIEAGTDGQARLLRESWNGLTRAGAAGGVVFEFADEWWKNYNNPVKPGNYWVRETAPDDELRHDEDPEETYGIMDAARRPKPSYDVVSQMFATDDASLDLTRPVEGGIISAIVGLALAAYIWSRRRTREPDFEDSLLDKRRKA